MSLGNIYIGGQLNDNNQATGYANSIDNGSATIEALGSGWIKTKSSAKPRFTFKVRT